MRTLLQLDSSRTTPLLKGPYISLSRLFQQGSSVQTLIQEGILHPHMEQIIPYPTLYGHQETALRAIHQNQTTLIATGTGSGKTECFLYPIISRCLQLKDKGIPSGITAVIVYPMNALAEDQMGRLRELLAGTGITFGLYIGKTPETAPAGIRLPAHASKADYQAALNRQLTQDRPQTIHPPEEHLSRREMRQDPPRHPCSPTSNNSNSSSPGKKTPNSFITPIWTTLSLTKPIPSPEPTEPKPPVSFAVYEPFVDVPPAKPPALPPPPPSPTPTTVNKLPKTLPSASLASLPPPSNSLPNSTKPTSGRPNVTGPPSLKGIPPPTCNISSMQSNKKTVRASAIPINKCWGTPKPSILRTPLPKRGKNSSTNSSPPTNCFINSPPPSTTPAPYKN
ncbi:MAG: DEAD/DEAH box helicase [Synechococcaceae cyanobacterium SM2_3_2]|nr:DEAD/DEAH box helicase [Synechococcaceae cyanobacterium SM2_3_2]